MSFLDQLRVATPGASAPPAEAPPEEAILLLSDQAEADRPPVDPDGPLPPYPFAIHSRTLGAEVWIVPDAWRDPVPGPTYSHTEVATLARQRPDPEGLRAIHAVKVSLDGEVLR